MIYILCFAYKETGHWCDDPASENRGQQLYTKSQFYAHLEWGFWVAQEQSVMSQNCSNDPFRSAGYHIVTIA
jgi:hypothetical protein